MIVWTRWSALVKLHPNQHLMPQTTSFILKQFLKKKEKKECLFMNPLHKLCQLVNRVMGSSVSVYLLQQYHESFCTTGQQIHVVFIEVGLKLPTTLIR